MKLSKLQLGLLVGGVLALIILLLMSSGSVFKSLTKANPSSLLAEVGGWGNANQVTFWKDAYTLTGGTGFIWDNIAKTLFVPRIQSEYIQSTSMISLYPGRGQVNDSQRAIILSGSVSISGRSSNPMSLQVDGGLRLSDTGKKPSCTNSIYRGTFWFTSGSGTKDKVEVCAKDSSGVFGWRTLY